MKLLEDIGMHYPNEYTETRVRFGVYECPTCLKPFRVVSRSVNSGAINHCSSCTTIVKTQSFIAKAVAVHGNTYKYILVVYTSTKDYIDIICPIHGVFQQRPKDHLVGKGCPHCAKTGFDKNKSAILYYLRVDTNGIVTYKIGITNRTIQARFNIDDLKSIQVLKTWEYPLGIDAYNKEQEILKYYYDYRYVGAPLLNSGNTELFSIDILGLDT